LFPGSQHLSDSSGTLSQQAGPAEQGVRDPPKTLMGGFVCPVCLGWPCLGMGRSPQSAHVPPPTARSHRCQTGPIRVPRPPTLSPEPRLPSPAHPSVCLSAHLLSHGPLRAYTLGHGSSPFCSGYFGDGVGGVSQNIRPGWPRTSILPISASQVAGITGGSYWCPAPPLSFEVQVCLCP
jgi:hypothetical protein